MRLCLVLESSVPIVGGGERQGAILAEGLSSRGVATHVITLRTRPDLAAYEWRDGYDVHRVGRGPNRWLGIIPVFLALRRLRHSYDVVHVSGFRALGLPAVVAGWLYDKHVVLRADNNGEMSGAFFDPALAKLGLSHQSLVLRPLNALRQQILRRADRFIAIASTLAQEFLDAGVGQGQLAVVPYGIDVQRYRPADDCEGVQLRTKLELPVGRMIFCFAGRLVRWKGPLVLLRAWTDMQRATHPAGLKYQLLFLGAGGLDQDNCEQEARMLVGDNRLQDSVRFLGDVTNVHEYLRASDVFVFPTAGDSFGLALLEAMATGLPCVAAIAGGMGDYVEDGLNALVVPGTDAGKLREAMERLATDPVLRRELGQNARRTAERYPLDRYVEGHLEVYAAVMDSAAGTE